MNDIQFENQSPEKDIPKDEKAKDQPKPAQDADASDAAWSEEMMEWAIASSTCGGLPRKEDETAGDESDAPACP